jgi:hypothetical protein
VAGGQSPCLRPTEGRARGSCCGLWWWEALPQDSKRPTHARPLQARSEAVPSARACQPTCAALRARSALEAACSEVLAAAKRRLHHRPRCRCAARLLKRAHKVTQSKEKSVSLRRSWLWRSRTCKAHVAISPAADACWRCQRRRLRESKSSTRSTPPHVEQGVRPSVYRSPLASCRAKVRRLAMIACDKEALMHCPRRKTASHKTPLKASSWMGGPFSCPGMGACTCAQECNCACS